MPSPTDVLATIEEALRSFNRPCDSYYVAGSIAYGLATPTSDIDLRGFCCRTREEILLSKDFGTKQLSGCDATFYTFDRYVNLLCSGNPNIIEMFGINSFSPNHFGFAGELLRENKHLFLTKEVAKTFGGFATAQARKLERGADASSAKRVAKQQSHYVRLCRMGAEILTESNVNTDRSITGDNGFLIAIKEGAYVDKTTGRAAKRWFKVADEEFKRLTDAEKKSHLPDKPDRDAINRLIITVNQRSFQ